MEQTNLLTSDGIDTPATRGVEDLLHEEYQEYIKRTSPPPQASWGSSDESSPWNPSVHCRNLQEKRA